ncbi:MAG: hypothetical protein O3A00_01095 [Planctomycetota bacterium]|nr:hypothetical protein [Planctomycetota bacterium]
MSSIPSDAEQVIEFDPVFLHARREAIVIFLAWAAALFWAVPYCYLTAYGIEGEVPTVWGIPSWLFWGIAVPWVLADLFTVWFCLCYMKNDELGHADDEDGHGDHAVSAADKAEGVAS